MTGPAWHEDYMVAYDCETTGVDIHHDRIVTAAIVHLYPRERPRTITWVIDPHTDIPAEASDVHGWTIDRIRTHIGKAWAGAARTVNGHTIAIARDQALFEITAQVALAMSQRWPLVAFNAPFDLTILEAECVRHGVEPLTARLPKGLTGVVDPFVIDKHYSRRPGSRKLADQVAFYKVMLAGAHDAAADALAAARLIPRMVAAYPELGRHQLGWLFQRQVEWRASQQASLAGYFDKVGREHDGCCGEWPLHKACAHQAVSA